MGRTSKSGGVRIRGNRLRLDFTYRGERCRETLSIPPTEPNQRYARKLVQEINGKILFGTFDYAAYFPESKSLVKLGIGKPVDVTFATIGEQWFSTLGDLAHSTRQSYRKSLDLHILPILGERPIKAIGYGELLQWLSSIPFKTAKTKNNTMIPVRQIFDFAKLDRQITENPAELLRNAPVQRDEPDPFELHEVNEILAHIEKNYAAQSWNYFEFSFFTGARPSEQIALQWQEIDFKAELARIERARVWGQDKESTKTYRARDLELGSRAMAALQRQKAHSFLAGGAVFLHPATGRPYPDENQQRERVWKPTLKKLGYRYRVPYQMRHTYATLNLMAGANPMWVARQLGHRNMKMILEVYSKWIDRADKSREKNKLEQSFVTDSSQIRPKLQD